MIKKEKGTVQKFGNSFGLFGVIIIIIFLMITKAQTQVIYLIRTLMRTGE